MALLLAVLLGQSFATTAPAPAQAADCQYFNETRFNVCGRFLQYWKEHGGLAQQGYPISSEFNETNAPPPLGDGKSHLVQYFERARFEYHPENPLPNDVLLGLLGTEQYTAKYGGAARVSPQDGCQYFQETGFNVCGAFLDYWKANGGLSQQGFPISGLSIETNAPPPAGDGQPHLVQYFQRARFEKHDELGGKTLLGLLGAEQYKAKYGNGQSQPPSAVPTLPPTNTPPPSSGVLYNAVYCLPAITSPDTKVYTCADPANPPQYTRVTIYSVLIVNGVAVKNVGMGLTIHYRTTTSTCTVPPGDYNLLSCDGNISDATIGYRVVVDVSMSYSGSTYYGQTSFTPVGGSAPPPSNPTPTPAPPPPPTQAPPAATGVTFVSVQGGYPGQNAYVEVQTAANAYCTIRYVTPAGNESTAQGLVAKYADGSGRVSWSWVIGTRTNPGTGSVTVTCNGVSASTGIQIYS